MSPTRRFLVKVVPATGNPEPLRLGGVAISARSDPLFTSIRPPATGTAAMTLAVGAQGATWRIVEPALPFADVPSPWDLCHEMVSQRMGLGSDGVVVFAEPDLAQQWEPEIANSGLQALDDACSADPQDASFPAGAKNDWYRDKDHGQFAQLPSAANGQGVRIAHLDTGFDPQHRSRPANLETGLAKNFVDEDKPDDAADDTSGLWNNRGHGTGTLSILAGAAVQGIGIAGVAHKASVVPIRVADRVVLSDQARRVRGAIQ